MSAVATTTATPTQAAIIDLTVVPASRVARILENLFPRAHVRVDSRSNAVVVVDTPDNVQQMRTIAQGLDIKGPQQPSNEIIAVRFLKPIDAAARLRPLYPEAKIEIASKTSLLIRALPQDMADIKTLVSSLDVSPPVAVPSSPPTDAIRVSFAKPRDVARALESQLPQLRANVIGASIILSGSSDDIQKAKLLAQAIDAPPFNARYTQIYRLRSVDATSVGDLVARSYPEARVTVDKDLNAISVLATAAGHQRIAAALEQLDSQQNAGGSAPAAYSGSNLDVVPLEAAMPGQNGAPSTSAQDVAAAVQQALQGMAPDLHITVPANSTSIILAGSPSSIRLAKDLIARLDRQEPLVVLDTEVLEVEEDAAKNIGLQFPGAVIQSQFQETQPTPNPFTGQPGRLIGLQPITRTAIQFTAALNFLVQQGNARVLADPRVTTLSGHTATIRAGDTINILTQTAGGVGTPVTQQLQQFNTGVTLDITPMVGPSGNVTVALHPVVNSLAGLINGVPQISTRDTQTVVQLNDNETLVIGGLIQETMQRQVSKLPLLGDIPLFGRLFQNSDVQSQRNELVIVVTPHIIHAGDALPPPTATLPLPTPQALPTLPPGTQLGSPTPARALPLPTQVPLPNNVTLSTPQSTMAPPMPTPTAFASTDVFTYGSPPPNTFANDTDTPQIFFAQFSPTVLRSGTQVQVFVVTTTNVRKVEVGYPGYMTTLSQLAPSKWQGQFNFNGADLSSATQTILLNLNAYNSLGSRASIPIPVSVPR